MDILKWAGAAKNLRAEELEALRHKQKIRLRRFGLAVLTYLLVTISSLLTQRLGLGEFTKTAWSIFIGVAVFGNLIFLILFLSGANLRFKDPSLTATQIFYSAIWGLIALYSLPKARPIVLMFFIPAFSFGILRLRRKEYLLLTTSVLGLYAALLVFEYLSGRSGFFLRYEVFLFIIFGILLSWFSFFGGFISELRRNLAKMNHQIKEANQKIMLEVEERKKAEKEKEDLIGELKAALAQVKTLKGLIPICASCKKIRDDKGYWNQLESYISEHSEAEFSHGICPECAKKLYGDYYIGSL